MLLSLSLSQLLAVTEEWSHLGLCGTCHVCHCGEDLAGIWHLRFFSHSLCLCLFLILSLIYRWTLASLYRSPGLYLGLAERATRFTETPTQSSEFVTQQHQVFVKSEKCKCASVLICVKVDGKGGGGPPAHTRHFLDLWHPCSQHTLFGVPVYFCYIQLITSRSSCAGKVAWKIKRV